VTEPDPREELAALAAALRVHAEACLATGALGLEPASTSLAASRAGASESPTAPSASAAPGNAGARTDVTLPHPGGARPPSPPGEPSAPRDERAPPRVPVTTSAAVPAVAQGARLGAGPTPESARRLDVLAQEIASCRKCRLCEERTQTVFARGKGTSGLCFVGEGPGADEDAQGFPFVGKAGQLLDKMIEAMGFGRDEVYVCNVVKCRPPKNRKPEPDEMAACRPYLAEQLELLDPKVIVALGATAVEGLLGISGGITRLRGNWRLYGGRIAVMPTFHPAYLLRTPEAKRDVWQDLQEVLKHLGRTAPGKK
jgi:uracil-DNA glycosylase